MNKKNFILILLVFLNLHLNYFNTSYAVEQGEIHDSEEVKIKLDSLKGIDELVIYLSNDCVIEGENEKLLGNTQYKIRKNGIKLEILQNDEVKFSKISNFKLKNIDSKGYIKIMNKPFYGSLLGDLEINNKIDEGVEVVNLVTINQYIYRILPQMNLFMDLNQLTKGSTKELVRAEAIIARTFIKSNVLDCGLLKNCKDFLKGYNLTDTQCGLYPYLASENVEKIDIYKEAINISKLQYLKNDKESLFENGFIRDFYCISNGGITNKFVDNKEDYLSVQKDIYDNRTWQKSLNKQELNSILIKEYPNLKAKEFILLDIENIERYDSERIKKIPIIYKDEKGEKATLYLEDEEIYKFFPSNMNGEFLSVFFDVTLDNDTYKFTGRGAGNGIGLSLEGAINRAKSGEKYNEILSFYYANTSVIGEDYLGDIENGDDNENSEENPGGNEPNENLIKFKQRICGTDRIYTSIEVAKSMYKNEINNLVLVNGTDFSGILSSVALAQKINAPILYVNKDYQNNVDSAEFFKFINERVKKDAKVYIIGGTGVISNEFIEALKSKCSNTFKIMRLSGEDRFSTNIEVTKEIYVKYNTPIIVANGLGFADILSIAPISAENGWPIVFCNKDDIDNNAVSYIKGINPSKIYIIGGIGAVSDNVINKIKGDLNYDKNIFERIGGADRYDTSRNINLKFRDKYNEMVLTTGLDFPDGAAGSIYAAKKSAPLFLVDNNNTSLIEEYIKNNKESISITVLGGQNAVSDEFIDYILNIKRD